MVSSDDPLWQRIEGIDLDPIKFKLVSPDGDGWSRELADRVEAVYRRFLYLAVTQPDLMVPTKEVDAFWHRHILDTRKYAEDCEKMFGFFLHHFPYFGLRGEADAQNLKDAFATTCEIYTQHFGSSFNTGPSVGCGGCGTDCGGQNCGRDVEDPRFQLLRPDLRPSLSA